MPTYDWLSEAGIEPSSTKNYTRAEITSVLAKKHGGIPYLGCTGKGKNKLDEVWYFNNIYGPVAGGLVGGFPVTIPLAVHTETHSPMPFSLPFLPLALRDPTFSLATAQYVPVDSTTNSSCPETGIQYLPKYANATQSQ